uniref:Uncharacterized protein n=1 Tax=Ditylenchus dipsaci TaxID=166011 RepID=A0A915CZM6_9BILA
MKRDAAFKSNLGNCIDLTKTLILKQRTNDPNRDNQKKLKDLVFSISLDGFHKVGWHSQFHNLKIRSLSNHEQKG